MWGRGKECALRPPYQVGHAKPTIVVYYESMNPKDFSLGARIGVLYFFKKGSLKFQNSITPTSEGAKGIRLNKERTEVNRCDLLTKKKLN